jgi:hypothetical protein
VHRIRLGRAGFFDPFGPITAALEADAARPVIVAAVARAEAEASGKGGVARVALAFERVLAERRSELAITERFDHALWLGDVEVDLSAVLRATDGESDAAVDGAVRKLVDMLPGGPGALSADEVLARVLPRIVGPRFEAGAQVISRPLVGALRVAWVLAYEDRARFVGEALLARVGITAQVLHARAIENLAARSERARIACVDTSSTRRGCSCRACPRSSRARWACPR